METKVNGFSVAVVELVALPLLLTSLLDLEIFKAIENVETKMRTPGVWWNFWMKNEWVWNIFKYSHTQTWHTIMVTYKDEKIIQKQVRVWNFCGLGWKEGFWKNKREK